ncbi:hypothetical protein GOV14_00405 [Candidatus Pacearchaeota archaeon]|nr:hypothetical protein [Candidatus Pacearchaeota archaeon]
MDEIIKSEVWKVLSVGLFLFVSIFLVLPYLVQVSTFFHEKGHMKGLSKYGVKNSYRLDLVSTIPNFFNPKVEQLGVTRFNLADYKRLDKYQRADINIAGIVSDLKFLFLIGVYLALVNVYTYYKVRFKQNYNLSWVLATNWMLFMWLLALVQITVSNITYGGGDIYQLVRFLRV